MKTLNRKMPYGHAFGAAYAYEQDYCFFDNKGDQVNEDGTPFNAEPEVQPDAVVAPAAAPTPEPKPAPKKTASVDPTIPYERQKKPAMKQLRARLAYVADGKKFPAGTSLNAAKKLILEAIADAAR